MEIVGFCDFTWYHIYKQHYNANDLGLWEYTTMMF